MAGYNVTHRGGSVDNATIGVAAGIILPLDIRRRYALVTASRLNTDPVYLMLSAEKPETDPVVIGDFSALPEVEKGIPLYPGAAYEIDEKHNLFQGYILGISTAAGQVILTQEGI
jgi:hypothetical protein